jgi:hypothetical protein
VQLVILPDKIGNPLDTNMLLWTNPRSVGSTKLAQPWDLVFMDHPSPKLEEDLGTPQVRREMTSSVEVWSSVMPHLTTFMLNTKSLTANETIISKTKFERLTSQMESRFQVTTSTTVFKAEEFMKELHPGTRYQVSGVGAKWQKWSC